MEQNRKAMPKTERLATEMITDERKIHKAKDIAILFLVVLSAVITIGLSAINYKNDCDWQELV